MLYCKRKVRIFVTKNRCFNKGLGKFFEWDNQSFKGRLKHYVSDGLFHKMISRLRGADMEAPLSKASCSRTSSKAANCSATPCSILAKLADLAS